MAIKIPPIEVAKSEVADYMKNLKPQQMTEASHSYYNRAIADKFRLLLEAWRAEGFPDRVLYCEILKLKVGSLRTMLQQAKTYIRNNPDKYPADIVMLAESVVFIALGDVGIKFSKALAPEADVDWLSAFQPPKVNTLEQAAAEVSEVLPTVVPKTPGQVVNEKIYSYITSSPTAPIKLEGFNLTSVEMDAARTILEGVKDQFKFVVLPDKIIIGPKGIM